MKTNLHKMNFHAGVPCNERCPGPWEGSGIPRHPVCSGVALRQGAHEPKPTAGAPILARTRSQAAPGWVDLVGKKQLGVRHRIVRYCAASQGRGWCDIPEVVLHNQACPTSCQEAKKCRGMRRHKALRGRGGHATRNLLVDPGDHHHSSLRRGLACHHGTQRRHTLAQINTAKLRRRRALNTNQWVNGEINAWASVRGASGDRALHLASNGASR